MHLRTPNPKLVSLLEQKLQKELVSVFVEGNVHALIRMREVLHVAWYRVSVSV